MCLKYLKLSCDNSNHSKLIRTTSPILFHNGWKQHSRHLMETPTFPLNPDLRRNSYYSNGDAKDEIAIHDSWLELKFHIHAEVYLNWQLFVARVFFIHFTNELILYFYLPYSRQQIYVIICRCNHFLTRCGFLSNVWILVLKRQVYGDIPFKKATDVLCHVSRGNRTTSAESG